MVFPLHRTTTSRSLAFNFAAPLPPHLKKCHPPTASPPLHATSPSSLSSSLFRRLTMVVSLLGGCLGSLLSFAVCFVYPAKLTSQLLLGYGSCCRRASSRAAMTGSGGGESDGGGSVHEYIHWTAFWIIFIVWQFGEKSVMAPLVTFFPFYFELKALLFYWLCNDRFRGAGWLWLELVEPIYRPLSMKLAETFNKQCPASVQAYLGCPPPAVSAGSGGVSGASSSSKAAGRSHGGGAAAAADVFEKSRAVVSSVGKDNLGPQ